MATEGAKRALHNYFAKQAKEVSRKRRRNLKPEKQVEIECTAWMRARGWDVAIYEAKAVYNPHAGRYLKGVMKAGTADCQGIMPDGTFVAVEFKAPGRLSTFNSERNYRQKEYLIQKINYMAFGAVIDSVERLKLIYDSWAKISNQEERKKFLLESLP